MFVFSTVLVSIPSISWVKIGWDIENKLPEAPEVIQCTLCRRTMQPFFLQFKLNLFWFGEKVKKLSSLEFFRPELVFIDIE